jgi:hypothetical protein
MSWVTTNRYRLQVTAVVRQTPTSVTCSLKSRQLSGKRQLRQSTRCQSSGGCRNGNRNQAAQYTRPPRGFGGQQRESSPASGGWGDERLVGTRARPGPPAPPETAWDAPRARNGLKNGCLPGRPGSGRAVAGRAGAGRAAARQAGPRRDGEPADQLRQRPELGAEPFQVGLVRRPVQLEVVEGDESALPLPRDECSAPVRQAITSLRSPSNASRDSCAAWIAVTQTVLSIPTSPSSSKTVSKGNSSEISLASRVIDTRSKWGGEHRCRGGLYRPATQADSGQNLKGKGKAGWIAGFLSNSCVHNAHKFQPDSEPAREARGGRDLVVECGRPPTGGPVRSNRKEHQFFPSLLSLWDLFHYGKNDVDLYLSVHALQSPMQKL